MKRDAARGIGIIILTVILSGCMASAMRLTPVTESNRHLEYNGFSVTAPIGGGWGFTTPGVQPFTTTLGKRGGSKTHTLVASIGIGNLPKMPPEELFGKLKENKRNETQTGRFRPVSFKTSIEEYRNAECQRYDATMEDRDVPHYEGTVFLLDIHGLTCLHPDNPGTFVDIQYSQRRLATEDPVDITAEGEAFLQSLEFTPLVRPFVSNAIETRDNPQMVAAGHGSLWVTRMDRNAVSRIAPDMKDTVATIDVGVGPVGLAVSDSGVWVANKGSDDVSRIDPLTNEVVATVKVGSEPLLVAAAFGNVWVTNSGSNTVSRIDPKTNTVTATVKVGKNPSGVGAAGNSVWVTNFSDSTVQRIDPTAAQTQGSPISVGRGPSFLVGDGDKLWVLSQNDGTLYMIDASAGSIKKSVSLGSNLGAFSIGQGLLWVADIERGNLVRIDPVKFERIDPPVHVGLRPLGVEATTDAVYVVDMVAGLLMRIEP